MKKPNDNQTISSVTTSPNSQNPKQGISPNKFTDTVLTPSEIISLRQDLKQAVKTGNGYFSEQAKRLNLK